MGVAADPTRVQWLRQCRLPPGNRLLQISRISQPQQPTRDLVPASRRHPGGMAKISFLPSFFLSYDIRNPLTPRFPAQFEIPNVHPASSLAFRRGYVFYQENATNAMKVVPVRWDGYYKNSRSDDVDSPAADLSGVSATHMDAKRSENYTRISYQRNGGDVAWLERGPGDDKWKVKSPVPIS